MCWLSTAVLSIWLYSRRPRRSLEPSVRSSSRRTFSKGISHNLMWGLTQKPGSHLLYVLYPHVEKDGNWMWGVIDRLLHHSAHSEIMLLEKHCDCFHASKRVIHLNHSKRSLMWSSRAGHQLARNQKLHLTFRPAWPTSPGSPNIPGSPYK